MSSGLSKFLHSFTLNVACKDLANCMYSLSDMFSAKALYNNVADTPDELSFSKGDFLEVLEKDDNGWWLCSLKGKVGIAPGNRLQILSSASGSRGVSPSGRNSPSANQVLPSGQKLPPSGSAVTLGQKSPANDQSVRPNWHLSNKVCSFCCFSEFC